MSLPAMKDLNLRNKRVIIREDFNVPMDADFKKIMSDNRIQAAIPTIKFALEKPAAVILLSHLGRPTEGMHNEDCSLRPVASHLARLLKKPVRFLENWLEKIDIAPGEIVLCENVRFNLGEADNDPILAEKIAALGDVYIMDAFATAHRTEASTVGAIRFSKKAAAGPLLLAEMDALSKALDEPMRPVVAVVGGGKVSIKVRLLENLLTKVDTLLVGGGIANTFLAAFGHRIGESLFEESFLDEAIRLMEEAEEAGKKIVVPVDVVIGDKTSPSVKPYVRLIEEVRPTEKILDIGPKTRALFAKIIRQSKTVLWNGPVGAFEIPPFHQGTEAIVEALKAHTGFSLVGGGDTVSALEKFGGRENISYVSTGGAAFLYCLEGRVLPSIAALETHKVASNKKRKSTGEDDDT